MKKQVFVIGAIAALCSMQSIAQQSVEVLHWWTSGGEAAALSVLKGNLEKQGVKWNDMPVAGGAGEQAMTALRARVTAGNPPTSVQMMGYDIQDWAKQDILADLNGLATKENWDKVVPAPLQKFSKYNGKWVAAPVNIHSSSWVWGNKEVLAKAGVTEAPKDWDSFIAALDKVQKSGHIALAHGGQPWQDITIFDAVALATGGPKYYREAFLEQNTKTLGSDTTLKVFQRMSQLRKYLDKDFSGRDWNVATGMVISGKAGFQMMGDWAKGEFNHAKKVAGKDYICFRTPGSQGSMTFNSDQFVMFKVKGDAAASQAKMASDIMDPTFQANFNAIKGSVPARMDVPDTAFDECGKKGIKDLAEASAKGTLVGGLAQGHAVPASLKNAYYDVVTRHFNGQIDDKKAVAEMVAAAKD